MKKRKELDALVSGKLTKKKREGHELLRSTGSDSSDVEEFSLPARKSGFSKRHSRCRLCTRSCVPLCIFVLMTACIVTSGGLVYMHLDLKKDLDTLREHLARVEQSEMAMPGQVEELKQSLKHQDDRLETLNTGDAGLNVANKHLAQLDKQIARLNKTTASLSASVSASQKLVALPTTVDDLSKQMASIGSEIESMKEEMAVAATTQRQLQQQAEDMRTQLEQLKKNEAVSTVTDVPAAAAVAPAPGITPTTMSPVQQLTAAAAATKARAQLEDGGVLGSYVEKEVASLTEMVHQLNDTLLGFVNVHSVMMAEAKTNVSALATRVSVLEAGGVSVTSGNVSTSPVDLLQLRADVDKLLREVGGGNNSADFGDKTFNSLVSQIHNITVALDSLKAQMAQSQVDDLNDLNSNLLSNKTVASLQGILAKAADKFKQENSVNKEELVQLEEAVQNLWEITTQNSNDMVVVKAQVTQLLGTVQNILDTVDLELTARANITANNTLDIRPDLGLEEFVTPSIEMTTVVEPTVLVEPTQCQREEQEALQSDLLGVYVPQCTEDGRYQPLQCHPSTGYCWCVDQSGKEIEGTNLGRGTIPDCEDYSAEAVTSPTVQKTSSSIQSLLSSTKAILDELATGKPAQPNKTDVAEILSNGTLATPVNGTSLNVTVSFNVTDVDIVLHDGNGTNTTAISIDGEMHDGNETLHAGNGTVNETEAGGNVTEPTTAAVDVTTEWHHLRPMRGYETPDALQTGFFRWDVNGDGHVNYEDMADFLGPKLPHREDLMAFDANGNGQLELPEFYRAFGFHEEPMHIPTEEEEMAENDAGPEAPPVMPVANKCRETRLKAKSSPLIGQYIPQCLEDGSFRPLQCHSSTGACWCVDDLGEKIEGTQAGKGIVPNCEHIRENNGEPMPVPVEADGDADSGKDINSLSNILKDFKRSKPDSTK